MADAAQAFIDKSRELLVSGYLPRIERSIEGLSPDQVWWRPNESSNSIGNLLLHLSGNVRQWVITGLGGAPDVRQRQQEFDERGPLPTADVLARLRSTVEDADRVLASVQPSSLMENRRIQGREVSVFNAVYGVVEHFSMHTGQIILLAKTWKGDLGFYEFSGGAFHPTWNRPRG